MTGSTRQLYQSFACDAVSITEIVIIALPGEMIFCKIFAGKCMPGKLLGQLLEDYMCGKRSNKCKSGRGFRAKSLILVFIFYL